MVGFDMFLYDKLDIVFFFFLFVVEDEFVELSVSCVVNRLEIFFVLGLYVFCIFLFV